MTGTLTALVVDDEPLARDELAFLLGEVGDVEVVGQAEDATTALEVFDDTTPDVVFVDLRMPGPDGLTLADMLRSRRPETAVVVVSAHDEGALRAFDARVADYLRKPVRLERLRETIDRIRGANGERGATERPGEADDGPLERLAVRRRGAFVVVDVEDVVCFEIRDELVWAVTRDDRFALDFTLTALEKRVPDDFFRCHRNTLVRLSAIRAIEPSGTGTFELVLDATPPTRVPLARERARTLRSRIPFAG